MGTLSAYYLIDFVPQDDDEEALATTSSWRVLYGYFPLACHLTTIIFLAFFITYDSVKFLIVEEKVQEAKFAIKRLYKHSGRDLQLYFDTLKMTSGKNTSNLTIKDALFNQQYRKSTWVNIGYIIFHELTGINVILLYTSIIFKELKSNHSSNIDTRQAT